MLHAAVGQIQLPTGFVQQLQMSKINCHRNKGWMAITKMQHLLQQQK